MSDHCIVTTEIILNEDVTLKDSRAIPLFSEANWERYQAEVENKLSDWTNMTIDEVTETTQIDEMIKVLTTAMIEVSNKR